MGVGGIIARLASAPRVPHSGAMTENPADEAHDDAEPMDTKARFRAALDRKRQHEAAGNGAAHGDSKISGAHAAAGGRRVFRRKSG